LYKLLYLIWNISISFNDNLLKLTSAFSIVNQLNRPKRLHTPQPCFIDLIIDPNYLTMTLHSGYISV